MPRQRVEDRIQLGADGRSEFALQQPHAIAALFQVQIAAVLLQLVIDWFGSVGIGSIDDLERVTVQLFGP
jgi:hypothetical protein